MISNQKIYNYLIELENNNNRDWYHENKELRIEVNKEFENIELDNDNDPNQKI